MKPILVTCCVDPDLDGVAGAIGYAEFLTKTGTRAVVGIIGKLHDEADYMLNRFSFSYPQAILNADTFDKVVLVDASEINALMGKIAPQKVIEIIDHRAVNEAGTFPNAIVHIERVGAAATLVTEKFIQGSIEISNKSATLLYGAILSNTLHFKSSLTTDRDTKAAAWLNQCARLSENFWKELFTAKSDLSETKLEKRMRSEFAWFILGNTKISITQIEMMGAKHLIENRREEIIQILNAIKIEQRLDFIFQNTIDLAEGKNFFVADDERKLPIAFLRPVEHRLEPLPQP